MEAALTAKYAWCATLGVRFGAMYLSGPERFGVPLDLRPSREEGWIFGRLADRRGRKTSLLLSVLVMCLGSLGIAVLPTHAAIGAAAPFLLLIIRMVQGLALGGEYGATATYMSEVSLAHRRGRRRFDTRFDRVCQTEH